MPAPPPRAGTRRRPTGFNAVAGPARWTHRLARQATPNHPTAAPRPPAAAVRPRLGRMSRNPGRGAADVSKLVRAVSLRHHRTRAYGPM